MRASATIAFVAASLCLLVAPSGPARSGHSGVDDRLDLYQVNNAAVQEVGDKVAGVIIVTPGSVLEDARTLELGPYWTWHRTWNHRGKELRLCPTEKFRTQLRHPDCTGFLVAGNVLATAGHCVDGHRRTDVRVVFGLKLGPNGEEYKRSIPQTEVYRVRATHISRTPREEYSSGGVDRRTVGQDWAYLLLDRPICDKVLPIRSQKALRVGDPVYMIGHPWGLPLKYAPGQITRHELADGYQLAIAGYEGNSGSPILSRNSTTVEAMYVGGSDDERVGPGGRCYITACTDCGVELAVSTDLLRDPEAVFPGRVAQCR